MSEQDDQNHQEEEHYGGDTPTQDQQNGGEEAAAERETEAQPDEAHGHSDETADGENDSERESTGRSEGVDSAPAKVSRTRISIGSKARQQQSVDNDSGIDSDSKKTRRRDKDASADVLNVIDWKLDGADKYDGSNDIPQMEQNQENDGADVAYENTEDKPKQQLDIPSPTATEKRKVQVRGKSLDEERRDSEAADDVNNNTNSAASPSRNRSATTNDKVVTNEELKESLDFLKRTPDVNRMNSDLLNSLMDSYLDKDYVNRPPTLRKPVRRTQSMSTRKTSSGEDIGKMADLEKNLKTIRQKNKKQPPPPVRNKPPSVSKAWEDPREQQRLKVKEKQWPPKEPPKDVGAYVVESYGRTDPYTKKLIKDVQRAKREEEERKQAEKRAEIVTENTQPVQTLRDTFSSKPVKVALGTLRPQTGLHAERSWIRHEQKPIVYDEAPEEPDWMKLIRNRRWKSTVKARFPCKTADRTEFERRSTTPKNWKKLAKDKNALKMLSEIVGIGAEGEELFLRLANQRQKIEEERDEMDKLAEHELLAYQVARESLGEDAAYSLHMDNPLPAARMKPISVASNRTASFYDETENLPGLSNDALAGYPFTTSQLEAAYLTNQLLRLHPEEFRKLISLERSRQATLRWQFSADPFDSVHEHQSLPYEMALLASDEPRVLQAMRKIVAQGSDDYRSVFSSTVPTPQPGRSRARSEGGPYSGYYYESDGYESSNSMSSTSSVGVSSRGRPRKKKAPIPIPKQARGRSVSPSMIGKELPTAVKPRRSSTLKAPSTSSLHSRDADDGPVQSHGGLFDDADIQLGDEIDDLNKLTNSMSKNIDEELKGITSTLEERKKGFFEEAIRGENASRSRRGSVTEGIDPSEISNRRREFVEKDNNSGASADVRGDLPKTRHKVRRINSNAQLNAVFRKRRQMAEVDAVEGQQTSQKDDQNNSKDSSERQEAKEELANVLNDIQSHYGD